MQKKFNILDNQSGMVIHLEPDILECEVRWALGSITTNKVSVGDGIPAELFQIVKMMLLKCYTQYASIFGKLISGHRTGKGQCSFQESVHSKESLCQRTFELLHNCTHFSY